MTKTLKKTAIYAVLVAGFAAGLGGIHARAADLDQAAPARTVHFGDLDISSRDGAKTLYYRVRAAAKSVCHEMYPSPDLQTGRLRAQCSTELTAKAIHEIDAPALTALYEKSNLQLAQR